MWQIEVVQEFLFVVYTAMTSVLPKGSISAPRARHDCAAGGEPWADKAGPLPLATG
jgi:hypothetical protein